MADIDQIMKEGSVDPSPDHNYKYQSIHSENIYKFMNNAYFGTGGFRYGTYLVPHKREVFYPQRRELSFYKNFVKPIIRAMVEPVYTKDVPRSVVSKSGKSVDNLFMNSFIEDVDNAGTNLQQFMDDAMVFSRLHGVTFIVMDNFRESDQPKEYQTALEDRIFPYIYRRDPFQIEDWVLDKFGNILSITFCEQPILTEMQHSTHQIKKEDKFYKRWTAQTVELLVKDGNTDKVKILETINHGLGVLPVISVYSTKRVSRNTPLVDPPVYDIARLNHAIYNKDSEVRDQERAQGFSVFYVQADDSGNITLGDKNVLFIPIEATIEPGFASPDPQILKGLVENGEKLREDLFRIAEQNGVTGVRQAKSGIAMEWDFRAQESVLQTTSRIGSDVEDKIATLFMLYTREEFEFNAEYKDDFAPNDTTQELKNVDMALTMNLGSEAERLFKKKAVKLLSQDQDQDAVQRSLDQIDEQADDAAESMNQDRNREQDSDQDDQDNDDEDQNRESEE